jgi:hypothetical protein
MFGFTNNPIEQLEQAPLLVRYQLGVTDDVDEEDMCDFKAQVCFVIRGH